ncbi:MAG: hypothetical protein HY906_19305 [Deltaproteobacteria bacterium]|nr:hypothetical protein [Deltaproteobacteria bacterium]
MTARQSLLAAILVYGILGGFLGGLVGCGGRTPAANGDGGTITDGPYQLDDAGNIMYDDAGNPIPVQQDAAPGQSDGPLAQQDAAQPQQDSGATPGIIQCGQTTCDATTQQCCITGGGGGGTATCIDATAQCQGVVISCDGPEDCPTGTPICCVSFGGGGGGVACTDACQGTQLCRLDTDCGSGEKCCGSGTIRNISATWCEPEDQCPSTDPTTGVPCGGDTCSSPDVCCVTMQGASCTADCQQGLSLACDGPEDCPTGTPVCCGDIGMQGGGTECVADGNCDSGGYTSGVVCHNDGDCQSGETCNSIPMTSIRICR